MRPHCRVIGSTLKRRNFQYLRFWCCYFSSFVRSFLLSLQSSFFIILAPKQREKLIFLSSRLFHRRRRRRRWTMGHTDNGSFHFVLSMVQSRFVITGCINCVFRFHFLNHHRLPRFFLHSFSFSLSIFLDLASKQALFRFTCTITETGEKKNHVHRTDYFLSFNPAANI